MANEQMNFPETWEEYEQYYGFNDTEEVYSNNIRLIPSFRVKQWLDNLKTEPCEDAISRQELLAWINSALEYEDKMLDSEIATLKAVKERVSDMPSVTQQPKIGHWIRWYEQKENNGYTENVPHCKCSECCKEYDSHLIQFIKFCNECGAKMLLTV